MTTKERNTIRYNANPKRCPECGLPIPYMKRRQKFCSTSCSTTSYHRLHKCDLHEKSGETVVINSRVCSIKKCKFCGGKFPAKHFDQKFCTRKCAYEYKKAHEFDEEERVGYFNESKSTMCKGEVDRKRVRRYLEMRFGHRCSLCGIEKWNGKDITFNVDHIDGNPFNRRIVNFRLVCPNCDSQLPTYKGRNKGRGRKLGSGKQF